MSARLQRRGKAAVDAKCGIETHGETNDELALPTICPASAFRHDHAHPFLSACGCVIGAHGWRSDEGFALALWRRLADS